METTNDTITAEKIVYAQIRMPADLWKRAKMAALKMDQSAENWATEAIRQRLNREPVQG